MRHTSKLQLLLACSLPLALTAMGQSVSYPNGNPGDWSDLDTGNPSPITPVATGGPGGGPSTQIYNVDNEYQAPGYGSGPYTFLNGGFTTSQPFTQSVDVYINANWAPAAVSGVPSFWLDMSPNQPPNYAAENSFQFTATGSAVSVGMTGNSPNLDITQSGWYDFQMLYEPDQANPADMDTVLSVFSVNNTGAPENLLASSTFSDGPDDITGTGYIWFTVWQDGFAGDTLDVANVQASVVPDSSCTLPLLGVGFGVLAALRRRVARA